MKSKYITICVLFLIFCVYVVQTSCKMHPFKHRIIKVIEADEFYIDINDNNVIDYDEHFKLKDVISYKPYKNKNTEYTANMLGLQLDEFLKDGYLARNWAVKNLSDKYVYITSDLVEFNPQKPIRYVKISFDNTDLGEFLLKSGLAYLYKESSDVNYLQLFNLKQSKLNAKEISKIGFYIVNLKNDVVHKLNCKYASLIFNAEIISKKSLNNHKYCSICFLNKFNQTFEILKSNSIYSKSLNKQFGNIQLFLINPFEYSKPNKGCKTSFCKALVKEINNAENSIDIAIYGFGEQDEIYNALLNAKKRNIKIRSVVDYSKNMDKLYPNTKRFIEDFNSKTDKNEVLMHNKFFIFDDKKVLSGSANISSTDSGGYNANIAVLINSEQLALIYKNEFEKMYNSKFSIYKEKSKNPLVYLDDTTIGVYFSPQDNILENLLLPEIKKAKSEIFVSIFYLTDKRLINELINAKNRNVNVMVMMDSVAATNFKDRVNFLRNNSIPVAVEDWGGKNHEKTMVIDSKVLILGSCNFSKSGFMKNDENMIKIVNSKIASFYRDYFLFLFNSIDKKFLYSIPRAEGFESKNSCFDGIDNNYDGKTDSEDLACKVSK